MDNHELNGIRLAHMYVPNKGSVFGVCEAELIYELTIHNKTVTSFADLVLQASAAQLSLFQFVSQYQQRGSAHVYQSLDQAPIKDRAHLLMPFIPEEVWGAGITYVKSRDAREKESNQISIYDKVYDAARPELFFKATASRCVGPNQLIGLRADSNWTVPETELAVVIGANGEILAYTMGNDMNPRDIEAENPLYLPQSKIYKACFSFGPTLFITDDPEAEKKFTLFCRILRNAKEVFFAEVRTAQLKRPIAELISYLRRSNVIPALTVLSTGTGIIPPDDFALQAGDIIEMGTKEFGTLRNQTTIV